MATSNDNDQIISFIREKYAQIVGKEFTGKYEGESTKHSLLCELRTKKCVNINFDCNS